MLPAIENNARDEKDFVYQIYLIARFIHVLISISLLSIKTIWLFFFYLDFALEFFPLQWMRLAIDERMRPPDKNSWCMHFQTISETLLIAVHSIEPFVKFKKKLVSIIPIPVQLPIRIQPPDEDIIAAKSNCSFSRHNPLVYQQHSLRGTCRNMSRSPVDFRWVTPPPPFTHSTVLLVN